MQWKERRNGRRRKEERTGWRSEIREAQGDK